MADDQQQGHQGEVRHHARPAVAHEGQGHPRERDEPDDAPDDEDGLQPDRRREPAGQELREAVVGVGRDHEAALDQHQEAEQDADPADVAQLGGDRGEHEVGRQGRHHRRAVAAHQEGAPEPGPQHPALGQRVERLDELEALVLGVVERGQPVLHPALDARHDGVDRRRPHQEQREPEDRVRRPPAGEVDHRQEDAEEQQRRAEVVEHHDEPETRGEEEEHRAERGHGRRGHAPDAAGRHRQQLALVAQVRRQEDHDQDLRHLAELDRLAAPDLDPEPGAVDAGGEDHGDQQQADAGQADQVAVALEHPVVGQGEQHADERGAPHRHPDRLVGGQLRADAVELDQADRREHPHGRQQVGVGQGGAQAQGDVHRQEDGEHAEGAGDRARVEAVGAGAGHRRHPDEPEEPGRDQEPQLAGAGRDHPGACSSPAGAGALSGAVSRAGGRTAGVSGRAKRHTSPAARLTASPCP